MKKVVKQKSKTDAKHKLSLCAFAPPLVVCKRGTRSQSEDQQTETKRRQLSRRCVRSIIYNIFASVNKKTNPKINMSRPCTTAPHRAAPRPRHACRCCSSPWSGSIHDDFVYLSYDDDDDDGTTQWLFTMIFIMYHQTVGRFL